ncbi:MAG TPA: zf-HC2 domain-containing protein [Vicinamibacterales bacterium]|nr:zf-HC2 domain-containing protein [Vicinamibacterales bacterium]
MNCIQYRDAIQELADGTLGPVRRAELQIHLDLCDDCRALAADLQKIRRAASSLEAVRPPDHVWREIARRLRQEGSVTQSKPRTRQVAMLAIAASLLLAVAASLYSLRNIAPSVPEGNGQAGNAVQGIVDDLAIAERHYESAIVKLEEALKSDDGSIDPEMAAIFERNLPVINKAIAESRSALQSEPQNVPARQSLFEALRKKVALLQDTIALMNEMRKGNSAGAARLVDSGSKS